MLCSMGPVGTAVSDPLVVPVKKPKPAKKVEADVPPLIKNRETNRVTPRVANNKKSKKSKSTNPTKSAATKPSSGTLNSFRLASFVSFAYFIVGAGFISGIHIQVDQLWRLKGADPERWDKVHLPSLQVDRWELYR